MKRPATLALLLALAACARPAERVAVAPAVAVDAAAAPRGANPLVDGAVLPPDRTIAANLAAAPTLSTFARLSGGAVLARTLQEAGPFTVFAPTDQAFGRLAPGTVDALLKPENAATLNRLMSLHVVSGRFTSADLVRRIAVGGGRATLASVAGEPLTLSLTGSVVTLTDGGGNRSYVEIADVRESDGVIHIVNGVLVPRL